MKNILKITFIVLIVMIFNRVNSDIESCHTEGFGMCLLADETAKYKAWKTREKYENSILYNAFGSDLNTNE